MSAVKLDFLDGQKLSYDCRHAVKVVAVNSLLLNKELVLIKRKVSLTESSIDANVNIVMIFLA